MPDGTTPASARGARSTAAAHEPGGGVRFAGADDAGTRLRALLRDAVEAYPELRAAAGDQLDPMRARGVLRPGGLRELLVQFEAARVASPRRSEIAAQIVAAAAAGLEWSDGGGRREPLVQRLARPGAPLPTARLATRNAARLELRVPYRGQERRGAAMVTLAEELRGRGAMTDAAVMSLRWLVEFLARRGERADLSDRRVVLLGAAAELSPTRALLEAGARVLWIDRQPPGLTLAHSGTWSGELVHCPGGADLLAQPERVLATILDFAGTSAVDIGMFASAADPEQQWRLAATMNAIVQALPPERVRSVNAYVSPTTPAPVQPEDAAAAAELAGRSAWARALALAQAWRPNLVTAADPDARREPAPGRAGPLRDGEFELPRPAPEPIASAVPTAWGAGHQAAQYVEKRLMAEAWAARAHAPCVSVNTIGLVRTRSAVHPLWRAALEGAGQVGVEVFEPPTSRRIGALLMIGDWLRAEAVGVERSPRALFARQVHGGIHSSPWTLDDLGRGAVAAGLVRRPGLLGGWLAGARR